MSVINQGKQVDLLNNDDLVNFLNNLYDLISKENAENENGCSTWLETGQPIINLNTDY